MGRMRRYPLILLALLLGQADAQLDVKAIVGSYKLTPLDYQTVSAVQSLGMPVREGVELLSGRPEYQKFETWFEAFAGQSGFPCLSPGQHTLFPITQSEYRDGV